MPRYSDRVVSICSRDLSGLRAWIELRRHSSVVISQPLPLTSMLPPSRTRGAVQLCLRTNCGISAPAASSSCQFSYLPQALNFHLTAAASQTEARDTRKDGAKSRVQTRLVGTR